MKKGLVKRGFTLIELLVVIFIIGILATMVVIEVNGSRKKSRDARRIADIGQVQAALEQYFTDHQSYPVTGLDGGGNKVWRNSVDSPTTWVGDPLITPKYLSVLPQDPINIHNLSIPKCLSYQYTSPDGSGYKVRACSLESEDGRNQASSDNGHYNCPSGTINPDETGACAYEKFTPNAKDW